MSAVATDAASPSTMALSSAYAFILWSLLAKDLASDIFEYAFDLASSAIYFLPSEK